MTTPAYVMLARDAAAQTEAFGREVLRACREDIPLVSCPRLLVDLWTIADYLDDALYLTSRLAFYEASGKPGRTMEAVRRLEGASKRSAAPAVTALNSALESVLKDLRKAEIERTRDTGPSWRHSRTARYSAARLVDAVSAAVPAHAATVSSLVALTGHQDRFVTALSRLCGPAAAIIFGAYHRMPREITALHVRPYGAIGQAGEALDRSVKLAHAAHEALVEESARLRRAEVRS